MARTFNVTDINIKRYLGHMTDGVDTRDALAKRFVSDNFESVKQSGTGRGRCSQTSRNSMR